MKLEAPDAASATGDPASRDRSLVGAQDAAPPRHASARPGYRGRRLWRFGRWALLVSLLGVNGWWSWRDSQPVEGLETIARWIEQDQEIRAEQALRHRLGRSPHDGEARIMLAKLL